MLLSVYQTTWCHIPEDSNTGGHNRLLYFYYEVQSSQNVTVYKIYYSIRIIFFSYIMSIK